VLAQPKERCKAPYTSACCDTNCSFVAIGAGLRGGPAGHLPEAPTYGKR